MLLQLAKIYRIHFSSWVTFANVSSSIRNVSGAIVAIRTIESWLLTALEFLMIGQSAFSTEDAGAIATRELPCDHSRRIGGRNDRSVPREAVDWSLKKKVLRLHCRVGEHTVIYTWNRNKNATPVSEWFILSGTLRTQRGTRGK